MPDPAPARLFGVAPGCDFPRAVIDGLLSRHNGTPPEALARVEIFVNTRRMQRLVAATFDTGPARLLPRIRLITDLATDVAMADIPPPVPPLRRRLELMQLISALLDAEPDIAPRSAAFDLADSLATLMDEMQGEGVTPEKIAALDVTDHSGHWARNLAFVNLVGGYVRAAQTAPDAEARQRLVVERLVAGWQSAPPDHPVIVAGSTGSRGATAELMAAVARLPSGAVVLPGFDFDMPAATWDRLDEDAQGEDHPQFRFVQLLRRLGMAASEVRAWHPEADAPSPDRNRLISLALRPVPVTDQWMTEGARLTGIAAAAPAMTLIEAPSIRMEAQAIALAMRDALEREKTIALVTPDRVLARQVATALDRWDIYPDDSAGRPLPLTAPGRFLRHVAALFGQKVTTAALLTLLKHPLTHTGSDGRGGHLLNTRELELYLRRKGMPFPDPRMLRAWGCEENEARRDWSAWLAALMEDVAAVGNRPLTDHLAHHLRLAEGLAAGPGQEGSGSLWEMDAGREARRWIDELVAHAEVAGVLSPNEYQSLIHAVLTHGLVRDQVRGHPGVMIRGTLEARARESDVVILGGLNEGTWPGAARPDPWLNRTMRRDAGLLLPERQVGLAAHDFQQAAAAPEVVFSRSLRDDEAQTVPSRWLNRLTNLMAGLSDESRAALNGMRGRGAAWLALARTLGAPGTRQEPAPRPSPRPPVAARPKVLSITEVQRLIRDPYAIYARHVLGLSPLDPIQVAPDAALRGTILHKILETFIDGDPVRDLDTARDRLLSVTEDILRREAPWPAAQRLWRARMARVADWFLEGEIERQQTGTVLALERRGRMAFDDLDLQLRGKIDRVDRDSDGRLTIYDYKTGRPPTPKEQTHFDKQLALAALMAEQGAIQDVEAARVAATTYLGLGSSPKIERRDWSAEATATIRDEFVRLIGAYRDRRRGYTSRRAVDQTVARGDYDHLARYGEWDESALPVPVEVGE